MQIWLKFYLAQLGGD